MGVAHFARHDTKPAQLTIVRRVLPENGFRTWLTDLKHALAGRVCLPSVVDGLTVEVANLSAVSSINRRQRQAGGVVRESDLQELNAWLATEKPSVAARVRNPAAPLYVEDGELCVGFVLDTEVVRRAASAALAGYCGEVLAPEHKAFKPLEELGGLTLGVVRPAFDGRDPSDTSAYRQPLFSSAAELREFCSDPNGYIEENGVLDAPGCVTFGPMQAILAPPQPPQDVTRLRSL